MPRSVEYLVDMHRLASQRRADGKPIWAHTIRLKDVFRDEDRTFEERRDIIVARIRASKWFKSYEEFSDLHMFVEELADAADGDDFDGPWDEIYDIAGYDRVWIETH